MKIGILAVALLAMTAAAEAQSPAPHPTHPAMPAYTKPPKDVLRKTLTPLQYDVTQNDATERPFQNEYWNNHKPGIYVDIATGEPLFSSRDKFDSGTGWPSFTRPMVPMNVKTDTDHSMLIARTEVRSVHGNSHLGHLFNDGPKPTGLRYCMNSASLRFIPRDQMEARGYAQYLPDVPDTQSR